MLREYRTALRVSLGAESKAYGFTLVIWATGAMTMSRHGSPGASGVVGFIGGALFGMAVIILVSFGGPVSTWKPTRLHRYALGAVHVISVAGAVTAGWATGYLPSTIAAFSVAPAVAVVVYQLILAAEVTVSTAGGDGDGDGGQQ